MNALSDREFQIWLDAVERGEEVPSTLPPEDAADLALAGRMFALRSAPEPRLVARVRETTGQAPVHRWRPGRARQWAVAGILAALVLTLTLSLTPAGTWAQEVFRRFGITFLPGVLPQWQEEAKPSQTVTYFTDEAEAQAVAGFSLRWPTVLPFDRTNVAFSGFVVRSEDGAWLNSLYADSRHSYLEVQVFWRQRPTPWPIGDARFQPIAMAGHEVLWAEGIPRTIVTGEVSDLARIEPRGTVTRQSGGEAQPPSIELVDALLWEDGETLYVFIDPERRFSLDDLLAAARSMYEAPR